MMTQADLVAVCMQREIREATRTDACRPVTFNEEYAEHDKPISDLKDMQKSFKAKLSELQFPRPKEAIKSCSRRIN